MITILAARHILILASYVNSNGPPSIKLILRLRNVLIVLSLLPILHIIFITGAKICAIGG